MLLKGDKLHLRALEPEDIDVFTEIENNTELWACSSTNVPYSRFAIRNFISSTANDIYADKQVRLVACGNENHVPMAFADITDFDPRHKRAQVGIVVFPSHRNCGIGTEVLSMLDEYARRVVELHTLYAVVAKDNGPSRRLFASAGYREVALLPQWLFVEGQYADAVVAEKIFEEHTPG